MLLVFSMRCNIYISCLCYDVSVRLSVRLSVTEVHWRIIANLGFKFRSKFTAQPTMCPCALQVAVHVGALWLRCMPGRGEESSRAMPATARPSCLMFILCYTVIVPDEWSFGRVRFEFHQYKPKDWRGSSSLK